MRSAHSILRCCLASAMLFSLVGGVQAVNKTRAFYANPTSYCQTALPVFDGNVRKRPLAVQNEGRSNAFVTCSFTGQGNELDLVFLAAGNVGDAATTLSCTGVTGVQNVDGGNQYITKTIAIPAGTRKTMGWVAAEIESLYFSVSCNLPPGVGINDSYVQFIEDVGA